MKTSLILQQHIPYSALIIRALEFSEIMLSRSSILYPFALLSSNDENHSIFVSSSSQYADEKMIEALQNEVDEHIRYELHAISLMVYCATVSYSKQTETDALVLTITDSDGHNNVTIYPFQRLETGLNIAQPYTCDFHN